MYLWRGSLLPLGCEAVATGGGVVPDAQHLAGFGPASRPSGSKLPRHGLGVFLEDSGFSWGMVGDRYALRSGDAYTSAC
jgi:hypothetical protein